MIGGMGISSTWRDVPAVVEMTLWLCSIRGGFQEGLQWKTGRLAACQPVFELNSPYPFGGTLGPVLPVRALFSREVRREMKLNATYF